MFYLGASAAKAAALCFNVYLPSFFMIGVFCLFPDGGGGGGGGSGEWASSKKRWDGFNSSCIYLKLLWTGGCVLRTAYVSLCPVSVGFDLNFVCLVRAMFLRVWWR